MTIGWNLTGLEPIEFASGVVLGNDESIPEPPHLRISPRAALERVIVSALNKPPCGVSFSGGRDSSGVLAAAAEAARKFELPLPIPVTLRFPGVEGTDESSFQEMVVRHLGLPEWVVLEPGDALDVTRFSGRVHAVLHRKQELGRLRRDRVARHRHPDPHSVIGSARIALTQPPCGGCVAPRQVGDGNATRGGRH